MKKVISVAIVALVVFLIVRFIFKSSGSSSDSAFELYSMMVTQKEKIAKLTTLSLREDMLPAVTDDDNDTVALFLAHPYLKLGFDLKSLTKNDVFERNDTIFINFPQPIVTHCGCNPSDREIIFDDASKRLDLDTKMKQLMLEAEDRIQKTAENRHLYERAANNAVELMCKLFSFDAGKKVCVKVKSDYDLNVNNNR